MRCSFRRFKAPFQVGDQVAGIFQAGMDAKHRAFRCEGPDRALDMGRNDQTFKPAPGPAQPEMLQARP